MDFWALWLVILDFFEGLAWKASQKGGQQLLFRERLYQNKCQKNRGHHIMTNPNNPHFLLREIPQNDQQHLHQVWSLRNGFHFMTPERCCLKLTPPPPHMAALTWPSDDLIFNVLVGLVQSIIIHHLKLKEVKFWSERIVNKLWKT